MKNKYDNIVVLTSLPNEGRTEIHHPKKELTSSKLDTGKNFSLEDVLRVIDTQISYVKEMRDKYPPQYCGIMEAEIQQREYNASIDTLEVLKGLFENE
jgi:hypothetical protein